MKKYYCTEHSFDRSHLIEKTNIKCQAKGFCGCDNIARYEVEEDE